MTKQIQLSHATNLNRYPDEYGAVKTYFDHNALLKPGKILSFGSSTGEEAISLVNMYFQSSEYKDWTIYGVDIDEATLKTARDNSKSLAWNKTKPLLWS